MFKLEFMVFDTLGAKKLYSACSILPMFDKIYLVKIQDLLADYLYQNKTLTLPSIGSFELDPTINFSDSKEENWPPDAIRFKQNTSAVADDAFIAFLVKESGKMRPLALSDLESYLSNGIQLLNIGKPFAFKGIGSLSRSGSNFTFQQGHPVLDRLEQTDGSYFVKDRTNETEETKDLDFSHQAIKPNNRTTIISIVSIIALLVIAGAIYIALRTDDATKIDNTLQTVDSSEVTTATDTTTVVQQATVALPKNDSSFQLLINNFTTSAAANARLQALLQRGHSVSLQVKDSSNYNIILTVNKPLSDTTYVIDSLKKMFLWKPQLVKQ